MSEHMKRCLLATVAHLLLLLSSPLNSASAYENIDGSVPSIHHDGHKTPFLGDEGPGTTHSSTSDDDFEWMRIVPHSIDASDVSRSGESPSNDDPDFVEQLLQTSGGTRSRTRSPTFGPSRQTMTTSSKTPTQTSPPWRSAMPTERASAMPTRGEVTAIDVDATQVVTTASPTASSSPIATAGEPAGIPTPRSTESPAAVNATASSDNSESQISSSHVTVKPTGIPQVVTTASPTAASSPIATTGEPTGIPTPRSMEPSAAVNATASSENNERPISSSHDATTGKPAGIVTTSSTSPSDVDSSLNDREHDRDGHESNNDDGTPNNNAEVMGGEEDDVVRVDVPRIICDMTMSPSLFRQTSERNRVLATTMTDTMRDLFDAHLRRASYDLRNISLAVEVKWNEDEYLLDGAARVHAHYRGSVSFSSGPTPTRDDLIKFLVRYFDVYDFADRWMLHAGYRDDDVSSVAAVNSVHFVLEDGTLIRAGGIEYEENELPNDATDAPTGRGMQVSLLIGVIVMACLLTLATFFWPRANDDGNGIDGVFPRMDRSRGYDTSSHSSSAAVVGGGATGRVLVEPDDDEIPAPSSDGTSSSSRASSRYASSSSSHGVSSLSVSPYTANTRSPSSGPHDDDDRATFPIANYITHLGLFGKRPIEDEVMARIAAEESPWRAFTFSPTTESI